MPDDHHVTYRFADGIATITIDDGKANVMSATTLAQLDQALDRAEADHAVVVLAGRDAMFSAGYPLDIFTASADELLATLRAGGELVHRLLDFPYPVVAACTGHAIAQGAFTILATDVRIGARGDFKIGLNEVAIGLTIPHYGIEVARHRLTPPWFDHATGTGELYTPSRAREAGFLDHLTEPDDVVAMAHDQAARLLTVDLGAHRGTKRRVRAQALAAIRAGIDDELVLTNA